MQLIGFPKYYNKNFLCFGFQKMINGFWNVYNRDGEEFKIQVKNETIPQPSQFEGQLQCEWRDIFCLCRPASCFPDSITIEKKSKNYLVFKEYGNAKEIWMRDIDLEEKSAQKKNKFVDLLMIK